MGAIRHRAQADKIFSGKHDAQQGRGQQVGENRPYFDRPEEEQKYRQQCTDGEEEGPGKRDFPRVMEIDRIQRLGDDESGDALA